MGKPKLIILFFIQKNKFFIIFFLTNFFYYSQKHKNCNYQGDVRGKRSLGGILLNRMCLHSYYASFFMIL